MKIVRAGPQHMRLFPVVDFAYKIRVDSRDSRAVV
jgi:hypothetical protein